MYRYGCHGTKAITMAEVDSETEAGNWLVTLVIAAADLIPA